MIFMKKMTKYLSVLVLVAVMNQASISSVIAEGPKTDMADKVVVVGTFGAIFGGLLFALPMYALYETFVNYKKFFYPKTIDERGITTDLGQLIPWDDIHSCEHARRVTYNVRTGETISSWPVINIWMKSTEGCPFNNGTLGNDKKPAITFDLYENHFDQPLDVVCKQLKKFKEQYKNPASIKGTSESSSITYNLGHRRIKEGIGVAVLSALTMTAGVYSMRMLKEMWDRESDQPQ